MEKVHPIILEDSTSLICIWSFPSSQPGRLTIWEHWDLRGEGWTELRGERGINREAEGLKLDFNYSLIGPHQLHMNLNSRMLSFQSGWGQGRTLSHQHPGRSCVKSKRPAVWWVFAEGTREAACGWHKSPTLVFPFPPDEAEWAGLPRAIAAQLICACFTMVLIKSPWSPGACVRSSHQKSKQRPGVADSLIMWQSSACSMTGTGMQLGWSDPELWKHPPFTLTQHLTNNLFLASLKAPDRTKCHAGATCHR